MSELEKLHAEIKSTIAPLPQEALEWKPGPEMNSLGVLASHVAGSERYWVGTVAGDDFAPRDRPGEFQTEGAPVESLLARLDASLAHSREVLGRLTLADLDVARVAPQDGREITVAEALLRSLAHVGTHVGHIHATRDLWAMKTGR
jgi:uncharacterized damage-inducible protein DinB